MDFLKSFFFSISKIVFGSCLKILFMKRNVKDFLLKFCSYFRMESV